MVMGFFMFPIITFKYFIITNYSGHYHNKKSFQEEYL